ncbi:hypothetical protein DFH09DRAFT_960924 [Mycena vulgaris]|nr:hypothetical protein DFH09DRAFT_960924 [Mycena vulgaris]
MTLTRSALALVFGLLPAALAQSTVTVNVGPTGAFLYDPPSVTASAGDSIEFVFRFVGNASALLDTWTFVVAKSDTPFWFHCEQTGHCGKGMVFAINAPADPDPHSFDAFQKLAMQLNGTGTATTPAASATTDASFTTPPDQSWASATATVTHDASTWTTVYSSYVGTPAPTFAPAPVDHKVLVGADGLNYTPSNISAAIGDTVTFEFHPKNHTVTQSSFLQPCKPLAETSTTGQVGFKSGFKFVNTTDTVFPTFQITINDTAPIWGYCGQQGPPVHCTSGMVFSINAVESGPNNFAAFKQIAMRGPADAVAGSGSATTSAPATTQSKPSGALVGAPMNFAAVVVLGAVAVVSALL